ncbi:hypothetical protein TcWFU_002302 [Taenia crassiceps]|uniref:Uncharacterized protein n=1 Tax=Taenia crassiceps TaxID=6207 RepID=A0ABR4QLG5_9CEST
MLPPPPPPDIHSVSATPHDLSHCLQHTPDSYEFRLCKIPCPQRLTKHTVQDTTVSTLPDLTNIRRFTLTKHHVATQLPMEDSQSPLGQTPTP